jgi:hypothetical protein
MAGKGKGVFGMALGESSAPAEDDYEAEDAESVDDTDAKDAAADEVRAAMKSDDSGRFREALERFVQLCKGY